MHLTVLTQTTMSRIIHLACLPPQIYLACPLFLFLLGIAVVLSHKLKITLTQNFCEANKMHYEDVQMANDSFQCCQMTFATSDEN